jgi:hypothetical protein
MTAALPRDLAELGATLERAAEHDLAAERQRSAPARRSRRATVLIAAAAIAVPAAAVGASQLLSNDDVARSLPAGTFSLIGTQPTCTTVTAGVEYRCTLARVPSTDGAPAPGAWMGTVEPTVDATKHVNGGCRSLRADGTEWACYIGEKAVQEKIIARGFLGESAPAPGRG